MNKDELKGTTQVANLYSLMILNNFILTIAMPILILTFLLGGGKSSQHLQLEQGIDRTDCGTQHTLPLYQVRITCLSFTFKELILKIYILFFLIIKSNESQSLFHESLSKNQYFVLRRALKYFKGSAHQKGFGTTDLILYLMFQVSGRRSRNHPLGRECRFRSDVLFALDGILSRSFSTL